jgi:hypothetical protein
MKGATPKRIVLVVWAVLLTSSTLVVSQSGSCTHLSVRRELSPRPEPSGGPRWQSRAMESLSSRERSRSAT